MDKQEKQKTEKQESKVQGTKVRMDAGKAPKVLKQRVPKKQQEMNPKSQVCRVMKRQGENGMNRT